MGPNSDRRSFEGNRDQDTTALALGIVTVRITQLRMAEYPAREARRLWKIPDARRAG